MARLALLDRGATVRLRVRSSASFYFGLIGRDSKKQIGRNQTVPIAMFQCMQPGFGTGEGLCRLRQLPRKAIAGG